MQVLPYLINTDEADLGGKIGFIFFGLALPATIWLYFNLPELKGRDYAEIQELFDQGIPARQFRKHECVASKQEEPVSMENRA
jgi:hypothetical protein